MITDAPADAPASGARLLLADDDPGVRAMLATLLRAAAGVRSVVEAEDGAEALALARRGLVDIAYST